ncbi:hypothetical protein [Streptomyces sp. NPDC001100]
MNTMSVDVAAARSTPCVAGARESARDLTTHPDSVEVAVHDHSPQAPRMRTPDLSDGTGGCGRPMVNRLAHTATVTTVTRRTTGNRQPATGDRRPATGDRRPATRP